MEQVDRTDGAHPEQPPLLEVRDVSKVFAISQGLFQPRGALRAVDGVSLTVRSGETLGVVGESGCGKSTLARVVVGLHQPDSGSVLVEGVDINDRSEEATAKRRMLQMVFQDPAGSLNPRLTVGDSVAEPLGARGVRVKIGRIHEVLDLVGLSPKLADRYPSQLSGGQQQRVCIARALISEPQIVVHDESVSALDVSLQAQVLNLLADLQEQLGLTYLFISHDLATVQVVSTRIAVMYLGQVVELAPAERFNADLLHPYSVALRSAVPVPDPKVERKRQRIILSGDVPSPMHPPSGCRFHTRCPLAQQRCVDEEPALVERRTDHLSACHFAGEFGPMLTPLPDSDLATAAGIEGRVS